MSERPAEPEEARYRALLAAMVANAAEDAKYPITEAQVKQIECECEEARKAYERAKRRYHASKELLAWKTEARRFLAGEHCQRALALLGYTDPERTLAGYLAKTEVA